MQQQEWPGDGPTIISITEELLLQNKFLFYLYFLTIKLVNIGCQKYKCLWLSNLLGHANIFFCRYMWSPKPLKDQHSNLSSKAFHKIIAEAEDKHYLPWQYLSNFFADVIKQISAIALAIPSALFGSYFSSVVLFNYPL